MKKLIVILLLFLSPKYALATDTSLVFPAGGSTDGSSYSNLEFQDSLYDSWAAGTTSEYIQFNAQTLAALPDNAIIDGFTWQQRMINSSGGWTWFLKYRIAGTWYTAGNSPVTNCRFNSSGSWTTHNVSSADCNTSRKALFGSDINQGLVDVQAWQSTGSKSVDIDFIKFSISFHMPIGSIALDSYTASVSAQTALLNISGDVATQGANLKCNVSIFSDCTRAGYARELSTSSIAQIQFNSASPSAYTKYISKGYYEGVSNLPITGVWSAYGVLIDVKAGWTCSYPASYYCTSQNCTIYYVNGIPHYSCTDPVILNQKQGILPTDPYYDSTYTLGSLTPESIAPPDVIPDCGNNPLCWVVNKVLTGVRDFFVPTKGIEKLFSTKDDLMTRVPFAYIKTGLDIDWLAPLATMSGDIPDINIKYYGVLKNTATYSATINIPASQLAPMSPVIHWARDFIDIFLYILFVFWIIDLGLQIV